VAYPLFSNEFPKLIRFPHKFPFSGSTMVPFRLHCSYARYLVTQMYARTFLWVHKLHGSDSFLSDVNMAGVANKFLNFIENEGHRKSRPSISVGIVNRTRTGQLRDRDSMLGRRKFFLFSKSLNQSCNSTSHLFNSYWQFSPLG
jgi:hypothetical protein